MQNKFFKDTKKLDILIYYMEQADIEVITRFGRLIYHMQSMLCNDDLCSICINKLECLALDLLDELVNQRLEKEHK